VSLQFSVLPFSSSMLPKDMHIFREPESWEVSTGTWSSPGPEHAWYKWLNGSWNSESLFHEENIPISGMIINGSGLRSLDDYKTFLLITKIPRARSSKVQWCRSQRLEIKKFCETQRHVGVQPVRNYWGPSLPPLFWQINASWRWVGLPNGTQAF